VIRSTFSFTIDNDTDVRLDPQLAGGALMDVGCYCISGARLVGGEPVRVSGHQVVGPTGVDVRFAAALELADGVLAHFDCGFDLPRRQELELVGAEGTLYVATPWAIHAPGIELRRGNGVEQIELEPGDRYRLQCDNFSRAIRGLEQPLLGRADALGQARTIDALYSSAAAGGEVQHLAR
jgi:predicted dehydrogenase